MNVTQKIYEQMIGQSHVDDSKESQICQSGRGIIQIQGLTTKGASDSGSGKESVFGKGGFLGKVIAQNKQGSPEVGLGKSVEKKQPGKALGGSSMVSEAQGSGWGVLKSFLLQDDSGKGKKNKPKSKVSR